VSDTSGIATFFALAILVIGFVWMIFPFIVIGKFNDLLRRQAEIEAHLRALRLYEEDERRRRMSTVPAHDLPLPPVPATFQVKRGETILGQFTQAEFREKIFSNEIEPSDLYRSDDISEWTPVANYRAA
jgi:hypothetical protein